MKKFIVLLNSINVEFRNKIIIPIHVSKSDCFKHINPAWCRCVTSTQTGMKELGTKKKMNGLGNAPGNVSKNGLCMSQGMLCKVLPWTSLKWFEEYLETPLWIPQGTLRGMSLGQSYLGFKSNYVDFVKGMLINILLKEQSCGFK